MKIKKISARKKGKYLATILISGNELMGLINEEMGCCCCDGCCEDSDSIELPPCAKCNGIICDKGTCPDWEGCSDYVCRECSPEVYDICRRFGVHVPFEDTKTYPWKTQMTSNERTED